jgi:hypothetical protein
MTTAPASDRTPVFARWSLSQNCDFREQASDPFDPIAVERELRPLQEASLALAEGRIVDGFAIGRDDWSRLRRRDETLAPEAIGAFSVDEILDYYGGEASGEGRRSSWAGCFGLLMPSGGKSTEEFEQALESSGAAELLDAAFPRTSPRWFGWWIDGEWSVAQTQAFLAALDRTSPEGAFLKSLLTGGENFREALVRSLAHGLAIRVAAFPPGRIEGREWIVDAHCPRCKAPAEASARFCRVCRRAGGMFPARVRKVRGERPYHPLGKLISPGRIAAIVAAVADRNDAG